MARKLSDIDLEEVSLVDLPAIKRKFLIVKRQNREVNMSDDLVLEDVEAKEAETEQTETLREVEKKLSDKATNAIKGALKMLDAYKKEFPDNVMKAFDALTEASGYVSSEKEQTEKTGRKLSKTTVEKIQSIIKELSSLIEEVEEVVEDTKVKKADKPGVDVAEVAHYIEDRVRELLKD